MEKLEKSLEKISQPEGPNIASAEEPLYRGLRKVEEKIYSGPTSIKYWM